MLEIIVKYDNFILDQGFVSEVTFTDHLTGSLDEITVGLSDPNHDWLNSWVPKKNDRLTFSILLDGERLDLPDFFVDSWDLTGWPGSVNLKALSEKIVDSKLRQNRTVNHYEVTLRGVVSGIAQRNGLKLLWQGEDTPAVSMIRQKNISDLAFLQSLARSTGRVCKVQNGYLIFIPLSFGGTRLERFGDVVRLVPGEGRQNVIIRPEDMITSPQVAHDGTTPTKREYRRYRPISATLDRVRGETTDATFDGGINTSVNYGYGSELAAWSAALEAHLSGVKIQVGILPRIDVAAGSVVYLADVGTYTGTYLVQQYTHKAAADGWTCEMEASRISSAQLNPPTKADRAMGDMTGKYARDIDDADRAKTIDQQAEMELDAMGGKRPKEPLKGFALALQMREDYGEFVTSKLP